MLVDLQNERESTIRKNIPSIFTDQDQSQDGTLSFLEDKEPELQKAPQQQNKFSREMKVKEKDPGSKPKALTFSIGDFSSAHVKPERSEVQQEETELTEEEKSHIFENMQKKQPQDQKRKRAAA